ncbi:iron chelate uptake ABC transporter family permease subunit [Streptomyces calidiresistens]|uniref:Iron chelate uptake ABC transporter family permease subunit n=1 Tax=Streptomyces calidiresistens TaxID=1485586 RepID=A0A7W3XZ93_9ACTN|nr:iron chelate uptake ABC transporter family permease subunit [Streptomyces calidiresistens]MBB0232611.1 iron chelate uptake ABC transporter family permease subunit [Streptomyces calidiresistens]
MLLSVLLLGVVAAASVALGARAIPLDQVWDALTGGAGSAAVPPGVSGDPGTGEGTVVGDGTGDIAGIVVGMRVPRTLLGLLVGAALGLAGAVMQALTRNPLAEPGILGVNAGASAAVVSAISFLGVTSITGWIWFAFLGAAAVSVMVYALGGNRAATPVRLALAGTAITAALYGYVNAVVLLDTAALDRMRFWTVGSLASARMETFWQILPFIGVGCLIALLLARPLNALALGEDTARALGSRPTATRLGAMLVITLLCGAATAACGPIVFVGLMIPHLVRSLTGPDLRWILPYSAVLAPVLLLSADILGRLLARPGELQVGIVTALIGGPVFIHLVRRRRMAQL